MMPPDLQTGRGGKMAEIGLVEAIASLREELAEATEEGKNQAIQFPVGQTDLEFQVGVTGDVRGGGKLRFWVLELSVDTGYAAQTVQQVTISLGRSPPRMRRSR
jgi:Trypsin-co-occurring domain 2